MLKNLLSINFSICFLKEIIHESYPFLKSPKMAIQSEIKKNKKKVKFFLYIYISKR